jgi:D-xylose transport system substrate-binding protein
VGVILPDTKSSARWETADRKYLEQAFKDAGVDYDIQNAQGDKTQFQTIADQMITSGVNVLMIVNLDSGSGKAVLDKAKAQGIATIDYDRLTLGGGADFYVSFDNVEVGKLQGQGLEKCLTDSGKTTANIAFLNGSPTDNNATLFKQGAVEALKAKTDSGDYTVVADQAVPDWDNQQAGTIFEQMYTETGGKIDGVLAANDGLGNAAIAILKKNGVNGTVPVTGQDATDQGLQNILAGDQCMTVYKAVKKEADAAAALAVALAGCTGDKWGFPYKAPVQQGNWITQEQVALLQPGMTREQVRFALGSPTLTSVLHANRWDYPYYYKPGYGDAQERKFTVWF